MVYIEVTEVENGQMEQKRRSRPKMYEILHPLWNFSNLTNYSMLSNKWYETSMKGHLVPIF